MRQLDLFGFPSETPSQENPPEKKQAILKEETVLKNQPEERPYSLVDLAEEVLNLNNEEKNDDLQKPSFFLSKQEPEKPVDKPNTSVDADALTAIECNVTPKNSQIGAEILAAPQPEKKISEKTAEDFSDAGTQLKEPQQSKGRVVFDDGRITVKIKGTVAAKPNIPKSEKAPDIVQKRGRKSFKEIDSELDLIDVPEDEVLFQKQYYPISEVAKWFRVNTSLLRFWENEFDVLKPKKNRKGDRLFRPEDVKNIELIYQLLRERKFTIEGAKEFIRTNKKKADTQLQLTNTLKKFKSFLLDLKANLQK